MIVNNKSVIKIKNLQYQQLSDNITQIVALRRKEMSVKPWKNTYNG